GVLEVFGAPPGRAEVAYVLQRTDVPPHLPLTVREVVTMGRYRSTGLVGRLGRSGREAVDAALERVGMLDQEDRQLQDLSGGRSGVLEVFGAPPGRAEVAYVLQRTDVPPHLPLTVREVVTMGRYRSTGLVGRLGRSGREAVDAALERVGMLDQEDRQLQDLSGG